MKVFLSAMWGALVGVVAGGWIVRQMMESSNLKLASQSSPSRELEDISPKYKADRDRELSEIEADYEPYRTSMQRALEIREMLNELLKGSITEHEAKKIAHFIGAEVEIMALKAERIIKELQPPPSNESLE